jgi:hypothetical protein
METVRPRREYMPLGHAVSKTTDITTTDITAIITVKLDAPTLKALRNASRQMGWLQRRTVSNSTIVRQAIKQLAEQIAAEYKEAREAEARRG